MCGSVRWLTLLVVFGCLLSGAVVVGYGQPTGLDTLKNRRQQAQIDTSGIRVVPWQFSTLPTTDLVSTDSLSRWQLWLNWLQHKERDRDAITYRLNRIGRSDAMIHQTHEPKHQQLYWEEISLNDPVSNTINWNFIPQFKIRTITEQQVGIEHTTRFRLRQYYLNKPLTKLNYTEGKSNFRSLNFMLTQNLGRKTNYELSYWDRRDGGPLPRNDLNGLQLFARVFHTLDEKRSLKLSFLMNNLDLDESFGYQIPDLERFDFQFTNVFPNVSNASSNTNARNIQINYYKRPDTTKSHNFQAALFFNNRDRELDFSPDSINYQISSIGGSVQKWITWKGFDANGSIRAERFNNSDSRETSSITADSWSMAKASGTVRFGKSNKINLESTGDFTVRSDGEQAYNFSAKAVIPLGKKLSLTADGSIGQFMPTIQEKYWQSNLFSGDTDLESESIRRAGATVEYQANEQLRTGVRAEIKQIQEGIHLGADSVFNNMPDYTAQSVTAYGNYDTESVELRGSATFHRYDATTQSEFTNRLLRGQDRLFLKGAAYWKGYAFNRATFVKIGLFGIFSPTNYMAAQYQPVLDRWQNANNTQLIPSFYRVDLDVSARVRWIVVTLRFENLLDDVGQAGYFNTAQFPLPNRRFLFGLKVRFRN